MRVLLLSTPSASHFTPLAPLAWALRGAGHDVVVVAAPDIAPAVRSAGLVCVEAGDAFDGEAALLRGLAPWQRPLQARPRKSFRVEGYAAVWAGHARRVVGRHADIARGYRPDLIVADPLEYSALMVGRLLDVPVVHHRWGVDSLAGPALCCARSELAGICRDLGIGALPDPLALLDPCPPTLQHPGCAAGTPIRHVPPGGGGLPAGLLPDSAGQDSRRRVVVSMGGTLRLHGAAFVTRLLRALADIADLEILATVPPELAAWVGETPAVVRCVGTVPLAPLLDGCRAVVHHGGSGTSMTSTLAGLPQLVLPQLADNFGHGDRLARTGAGISVEDPEAQDDPRTVRDALTDLLEGPGFRTAGTRLRAEALSMPTPAAVVEELAGQHGSGG
ncbi:nucleotide disphospho-sugar-binding domain-containing protein [Streptomyces sp. NPDC059639]|uniref:nucleotide disphospho-sugar-binding domain-containing protein n=1 Tax=Streptomyces sp. NPDC059639 TaxID=3346891 RepID=UPI0036A4CA67